MEEDPNEESEKDDFVDLYAKRPLFNKNSKKLSSDELKSLGDAAIPYGQIEYLHDLRMELSVEFGRAKIKLKDILVMKPGSICMLERFLGEAVDVMIGKKFMAKGEIVIVNERYGIRLSEIIRSE